MFFSCFKSKKQTTDEGGVRISDGVVNSETATGKGTEMNKKNQKSTLQNSTQGNGSSTSVPKEIKLAPRSAVLQTPKQAVGERIVGAKTEQQQNRPASEDIANARTQGTIDLNSGTPINEEERGAVVKRDDDRELANLPNSDENGSESGAPNPIAGMKPIFSVDQNDELRLALAKRAAKQQATSQAGEAAEPSGDRENLY